MLITDSLQSASSLPLKARKSFKISQWTRRTKTLVVACICFALTVALLGFGIYAIRQIVDKSMASITSCDLQNTSDIQKRFSLDIRLASDLSYLQARAIALSWDLVVGQGGRFLQGWLLYKVSCDALVFLMERSSVPYNLFATLTLSSGSWESFFSIAKLLGRRRTYETILTAIWLLWSTVYVLGFPTLWSAASAYVNPTEWVYQMPDYSLLNLSSSQLSYCYACTDCARIGLQDNMTLLSDPFSKLLPANQPTYQFYLDGIGGNTPYVEYALQLIYYDISYKDQGDLAQVVNYTSMGGEISSAAYNSLISTYPSSTIFDPSFPAGFNLSFDPVSGETFEIGTHESSSQKPPWVFNSSVPRDPYIIPYNSSFTLSNTTYQVSAPLLRFSVLPDNYPAAPDRLLPNSIGLTWSSDSSIICHNGKLLPSGWLEPDSGNLFCIGETGFVWGFSSLLVLIGLSLQLAWAIGLYLVWLNANLRSDLCRSGRNLGGVYRSATDLVGAMREDLGDKIDYYNNKEMKQALAKYGEIGWELRGYDKDGVPYVVISSGVEDAGKPLLKRKSATKLSLVA